ncbi:hypothetical protein [Arenimonas sp. SCN 70-307]|uniref:hypothetical protein n=1 Tax=Arenimonas sp. SCN 70-307 TaxID=1660089 RepID=UPI000B189679|nr:hypothetical protein [Arenimonas sp. SCN 70-307]
MTKPIALILALAASLLAAPALASQRVAIIDPNGFEKPMPAQWVQLPAGWQTQGGVLWDQSAPCGATPSLRWQARSPDGSQLLTIHPSEAWTWDNLGFPPSQGNCPRQPITSARQYLETWIRRQRPGARVLDYRDRPDYVRSPPPPAAAGTTWRKEAGEVLLAYAAQGTEVREVVAVVVLFSDMSMPGVMPGEVRRFMSGTASGTTTLRAPAGRLEIELLGRIAGTMQVDPQWQARMDRHNRQVASDGLRGQVARGQIISETNREISDMNMRGWQDRNAANDRMHDRSIDAITGTTRYQDPAAGGAVRLDGFSDNAWRAADGSYIQSDDPHFDPNRDLDTEAERLERIE